MFDPLAILRRTQMNFAKEEAAFDSAPAIGASMMVMPKTLTEVLDQQIRMHENEIKKLKEAKEAISPEVEKALNALAKL